MESKIEQDSRRSVIIVASGPSALEVLDYQIDKTLHAIIAVNGAIDWLPEFDYWFTLDLSPENVRRMNNPCYSGRYVIAFPPDDNIPPHVVRLERYSVGSSRYAMIKNGKLTCAIGLNENNNVINSGNSAFGALGLAYHLGFTQVALIGVDADSQPRVEGGYSRDLSHLPQLFESAMPQINLVNCGKMKSSIPCLSLKEYLQSVI